MEHPKQHKSVVLSLLPLHKLLNIYPKKKSQVSYIREVFILKKILNFGPDNVNVQSLSRLKKKVVKMSKFPRPPVVKIHTFFFSNESFPKCHYQEEEYNFLLFTGQSSRGNFIIWSTYSLVFLFIAF